MRRQRLIWFAAGMFVSCAVWILAYLVLMPGPTLTHESTIYLVLEEPTPSAMVSTEGAAEEDELSLVANRSGEVLRNCGAEYFDTEPPFSDHVATANLPMIDMNFGTLACIFEAAEAEGIQTRFEHRWGDARADYYAARQAFEPETK